MENPCQGVLCRGFYVTKVLYSGIFCKRIQKFFAGNIKYTTFVVQKINKR